MKGCDLWEGGAGEPSGAGEAACRGTEAGTGTVGLEDRGVQGLGSGLAGAEELG